MPYVTSETLPPKWNSSVTYWERSPDPAHRDAFKDTEMHKNLTDQVSDRRLGWMAVDWCENAIGFVPDGTAFEEDPDTFELKLGYFKDDRMFAYRVG